MELLDVLYEQYKFRKIHKRVGTHALFVKDSCLSVSQSVCEIVKLSGFERPQKMITICEC
jgi:hypothetical protein